MKKHVLIFAAICLAIVRLHATTIQVNPGDNTIYNAIIDASPGDTLIIANGTYNEPNTTVINKALVIQAAAGATPFVNHKRYDINVGNGDNVTIKGLIFDNTSQSGTEMVRVNSGTNNKLKFIDCTFQNGTSYGIRLYNVAVQVDSLIISGCVFKNLGNHAVYNVNGGTSPGLFKNSKIENSTFMNITGSAIYLRDNDGAEGNDPKVLIDHCTFYNTALNNYVIYLNRIAGATVQNCIVSNDANKQSSFAYYVYGGTILNNSIWYNCVAGVRTGGAIATNLLNQDPKFINPLLENFNLDATSPAVAAGTDGLNMGDTRWSVSAASLGVTMTAPAANEETSDIYRLRFVPSDPDGDAIVSLYYSLDNVNWTLIVNNLASSVMFYDWNVRTFAAGSYFVKAIINKGENTISHTAAGKVVVVPDLIPPRTPSALTGQFAQDRITLTWNDPVTSVPVETPIDNFEAGIANFIETKDGADGSFISSTGYVGNGIQVNFNIQVAWKEYGVKTIFDTPIDYVSTINFWYKGDGSSNKIRVIIEHENGDWWYTETVLLNSTNWQKAELNSSVFGPFSWHPNQKTSFDKMNVKALNFIVASGVSTTGSFTLDEISFSGNIPPSTDFEGTKIVRRTDRYPANYTDGALVYDGTAETFVDENIVSNTDYYYAAFAYDDLGNHSAFDSNAAYQYDGMLSSTNNTRFTKTSFFISPTVITTDANMTLQLIQNQNVTVEIYNTIGMKVLDIINMEMPQGSHTITFNSTSLSNGLYFIKMTAGNETSIERIIIKK